MAKYEIADGIIKVDGVEVAKVEIIPGDYHDSQLVDMVASANREVTRPRRVVPLTELNVRPPTVVEDVDCTTAGDWLTKHHIPMIGPEVGQRLLDIIRRFDVVFKIYTPPETVEVYRAALYLAVMVAMDHQKKFVAQMEKLIA